MAEVTDVDPDLRSLARRVPEDIRVNLSQLELRLRAEHAQALLTEAETAEGVKADRLRAKAGRVLKAVSPATYSDIQSRMSGDIRLAQLEGADRQAYELQEELRAFEQRNPQVDPARVMEAAWAALSREKGKLPPIPPPTPSHQSAFTRRFGRAKRKTR